MTNKKLLDQCIQFSRFEFTWGIEIRRNTRWKTRRTASDWTALRIWSRGTCGQRTAADVPVRVSGSSWRLRSTTFQWKRPSTRENTAIMKYTLWWRSVKLSLKIELFCVDWALPYRVKIASKYDERHEGDDQKNWQKTGNRHNHSVKVACTKKLECSRQSISIEKNYLLEANHRTINQSINQSIDRPINSTKNQSNNQSINRTNDQEANTL